MSTENTFDFNQARIRIISFKSRLRSALFGSETNLESIVSQFECSLGKWIYDHAMADYGHIKEMQQLEREHAQMHIIARELLEQYQSGQADEARAGLAKVEAIADQLVSLIDSIEHKSESS